MRRPAPLDDLHAFAAAQSREAARSAELATALARLETELVERKRAEADRAELEDPIRASRRCSPPATPTS